MTDKDLRKLSASGRSRSAASSASFGAEGLAFDDSWVTTRVTYVSFRGPINRTRVDMPFHVTSLDWQESDRLLARLLTASSGPTDAIPVGGYGTFDGAVTQSMDNPRIAVHFAARHPRMERHLGGREGTSSSRPLRGRDRRRHRRSTPEAAIRADGRFSLGPARKDGGERDQPKVSVTNWAMAICGRPSIQTIGCGRHWRRESDAAASPVCSGRDDADRARAGVEGIIRGATGNLTAPARAWTSMDRMAKSTGAVTGSAQLLVGSTCIRRDGQANPPSRWIGSGSSSAADRHPEFRSARVSELRPPTYHVTGESTTSSPATGHRPHRRRAHVAGNAINFERFDVTSNLLQIIGSGKIGLDDAYTSALTLTFVNSSLDPYINAFKAFPYTKLQVSGKMNVAGPLADWEHLRADATITNSSLTLFDYELHNDSPIVLSYDQDSVKIGRLELVGQGTRLALTGGLSVAKQTVDIGATGTASLEILKGYRDLTGAGQATQACEGPWSVRCSPCLRTSRTGASATTRCRAALYTSTGGSSSTDFDQSRRRTRRWARASSHSAAT
jgi:hypothetical protein